MIGYEFVHGIGSICEFCAGSRGIYLCTFCLELINNLFFVYYYSAFHYRHVDSPFFVENTVGFKQNSITEVAVLRYNVVPVRVAGVFFREIAFLIFLVAIFCKLCSPTGSLQKH